MAGGVARMDKTEEDVTLIEALGTSERTRIFGFIKFEMQTRHLLKYTIDIICFLHVI